MYSVGEIVSICHKLAPPHLAESYDNVGLLVGDSKAQVERVLCALDLNEAVVQEAIDKKVQCIITHHPFIFKALKKIDLGTAQGRIIKALMIHDIHLIAMHTNLDIAQGGINDYLAKKIGLMTRQPLKITHQRPMYKVGVYVPTTHVQVLRQAIVSWNPTTIGDYKGCTFSGEGVGTFIPLEGSNPTIGTHNALEEIQETKLECMIDSNHLAELLNVIKSVHPYEEVAYDVYRLEHLTQSEGIGRWGQIEPISLDAFINQVKAVFNIPYIRVTAKEKKMIQKVAICSGSGSSFIQDASRVADVYITGDMTFHMAQDAMNQGLIVLDVGHYASEHIAMPLIRDYLEDKCKGIEVVVSEVNGEVFEIN